MQQQVADVQALVAAQAAKPAAPVEAFAAPLGSPAPQQPAPQGAAQPLDYSSGLVQLKKLRQQLDEKDAVNAQLQQQNDALTARNTHLQQQALAGYAAEAAPRHGNSSADYAEFVR